MRIVALFCNAALFVFTGFVLVTDGPPAGPVKAAFAAWMLATLALSIVAIVLKGRGLKAAAVAANVLLVGLVFWNLVKQYPHPREAGFMAYVVLMLVTPLLNLAALSHRKRTAMGRG